MLLSSMKSESARLVCCIPELRTIKKSVELIIHDADEIVHCSLFSAVIAWFRF